jgi:hypothetical protein
MTSDAEVYEPDPDEGVTRYRLTYRPQSDRGSFAMQSIVAIRIDDALRINELEIVAQHAKAAMISILGREWKAIRVSAAERWERGIIPGGVWRPWSWVVDDTPPSIADYFRYGIVAANPTGRWPR